MGLSETYRWNLGLFMSLMCVIISYFAKLKYTTPDHVLKENEESLLVYLLFLINATTIGYGFYWPQPVIIVPKNQSVTTRIDSLVKKRSAK